MREHEFNIANMNVSYGVNSSKMHDTIVKEVGPCLSIVDVGETQRMYFNDKDDDPFWMNDKNEKIRSWIRFRKNRR